MKQYTNQSADHSLLYEFQIRDYSVIINSIDKKHRGEQNMVIGDLVISCEIKNTLLYFKNYVPTDEEIERLQPVVLKQGKIP